MNISGIREPEIFQSDSESTDVENKLSQLPTESSSDSNEDCINDSQSSEQALVEQNQTFIHENEGHRIPTEHAENESKSTICYVLGKVSNKANSTFPRIVSIVETVTICP